MFARAKGKQQNQVRQLQCQEQCIDYIPYYLSGLSRALFFPTTFLEIAVYFCIFRDISINLMKTGTGQSKYRNLTLFHVL